MFDGLKDKLDSFRSEAEKAAEEAAEPIEDDEADSGVDTDQEATPEAEEETADESDAETEADEDDAEADEDDAEADTTDADEDATEVNSDADADEAGGVEADEEADESEADTTDADEDSEDEESEADEDSEDEDSSNGTSFTRKLGSAVRGRVVIEEDDLEDPLWDLEMALLESDVEMSVAEAILDEIKDDLVGEERKFTQSTAGIIEDALRDALLSVMSVGQFDFDERVREADKPVVIVFTGVNGVGKTTSIAKLSKYLEDQGLSTVWANGDTYRAGANEQIKEHAANRDAKLISHEMGGDPTAVIYDAVEYAEAHDVDVVLGDTAGRLHTNNDLMEQLAKIHRVVDPDMTLFVDEAVAGQDAVNRAREFNEAAEVDGTILTMADADSQGGAAISIAHVTGKPILFLGTGQGYDDLQRFDPDELVDDLLGE